MNSSGKTNVLVFSHAFGVIAIDSKISIWIIDLCSDHMKIITGTSLFDHRPRGGSTKCSGVSACIIVFTINWDIHLGKDFCLFSWARRLFKLSKSDIFPQNKQTHATYVHFKIRKQKKNSVKRWINLVYYVFQFSCILKWLKRELKYFV